MAVGAGGEEEGRGEVRGLREAGGEVRPDVEEGEGLGGGGVRVGLWRVKGALLARGWADGGGECWGVAYSDGRVGVHESDMESGIVFCCCDRLGREAHNS